MLANISTFENLQANTHRQMGLSNVTTFNDRPMGDTERQRRMEQYTEEIKELQQEIKDIFKAAKDAQALAEKDKWAIMDLPNDPVEDLWRSREIIDRIDVLDRRAKELQSKDVEKTFTDFWLDIARQINEFKSRIKAATDTPQYTLPQSRGLSNMAAFN